MSAEIIAERERAGKPETTTPVTSEPNASPADSPKKKLRYADVIREREAKAKR